MENNSGCVYLVGAGPGDPDLLTVKAMKVIQAADVIVYDRLVSQEILDLAPAGATRISVGKQPRHHPVPQEEINDLIVRIARKGRIVVRLKGGDPLVFGRGSEEALELVSHGVNYEVVPGITAAQGCAASCGIPLTHRGLASGVRYVTGHCRQDRALDFDWDGLADPDTTLVVYMGRANIAEISEKLIAHGLAPDTPVLAVSNATTPRERRLCASLADMPECLEGSSFEGPVLFIIGKVATLSGKLGKQNDLASNIGSAVLA